MVSIIRTHGLLPGDAPPSDPRSAHRPSRGRFRPASPERTPAPGCRRRSTRCRSPRGVGVAGVGVADAGERARNRIARVVEGVIHTTRRERGRVGCRIGARLKRTSSARRRRDRVRMPARASESYSSTCAIPAGTAASVNRPLASVVAPRYHAPRSPTRGSSPRTPTGSRTVSPRQPGRVVPSSVPVGRGRMAGRLSRRRRPWPTR